MTEVKNSFGLSKVRHVVAVSSCKGGVGKSTVAAGMARALSAKGLKVGLLDADIHGPSVPTLFNIHSPKVYTNEFKMVVPIEAEGIKLMSFGFLLGDAPAVMRGPILTRYMQQLLFQTDWGTLDYLLIDMPPGTGDVQLTITQGVRLTGAVIVTTRQTLALVDVARGILMFEKVNVPVLGVIENMAYFLCGKCQEKHYIFGESQSLEKRFGVKTIAEIPLLPNQDHGAHMAKAAGALEEAVGGLKGAGPLPQTAVSGGEIQVSFSNGEKSSVKFRDLRLACMCALCLDEITGKPLIDPSKIPADIAPKEIVPLGNYALSITWSDGHSSGIYPYSLFKSLSK